MSETIERIHPLRLPMPSTLGRVTAYLVEGPRGAALVDTGMNDASARKELLRQLGRHGLEPSDLETVVCTHHHPDHCGLAGMFRQAGVEVAMSGLDARSHRLFLAHPELDATRATFHGRHEVPADFEKRVSALFPFFRTLSSDFEPTRELRDGERIELGGIDFEVVHTPGHTPGHVCLLSREGRSILTGDHVLSGEVTHVSMREEAQGTDPLGCFLDSLEKVARLGPLSGLPAHGRPVRDVPGRCRQLVEHHLGKLAELESALGDEPRTAFDLAGQLLRPRAKVFSRWQAMSQTLGYLEHLVRHERAVEGESERGVTYRRRR